MKKIKHPHIVAIIQARMGSKRLPGKTMINICEKPLLQLIIERVRQSKLIDKIVVATTEKQEDDVIIKFCNSLGIKSFKGSENDVLDRYYQCGKIFKADIIVRITGDCPFADPDIIDKYIEHYLVNRYDYVSNAYPKPKFPDGLDVEVFSFYALEKAWKKAKLASEREHVTPYIWKNEGGKFKIYVINNEKDLSNKRWTLDNEKDLRFVRAIYDGLYKKDSKFRFKDILDFLNKNPKIEKINAKTMRNKGYKKSLMQDKNNQKKP